MTFKVWTYKENTLGSADLNNNFNSIIRLSGLMSINADNYTYSVDGNDWNVEVFTNETGKYNTIYELMSDYDSNGYEPQYLSTSNNIITLSISGIENTYTNLLGFSLFTNFDTNSSVQYRLGTDINTSNLQAYNPTFRHKLSSNNITSTYGTFMSNDGLHYYLEEGAGSISHYTLSTPFDLTTSSLANTFSDSERWYRIFISPDGTKGLIFRYDIVVNISMSTPFDISTVSLGSSYNFGDDRGYNGIWLTLDGTKLILSPGSSSNEVRTYSLSTAFDCTTSTQISGYTITNTSYEVFFSNNGDKFIYRQYVNSIDEMWVEDLTTPFDLTTHTNLKKYNLSLRDISFCDNGKIIATFYDYHGNIYALTDGTLTDSTNWLNINEINSVSFINKPNYIQIKLDNSLNNNTYPRIKGFSIRGD